MSNQIADAMLVLIDRLQNHMEIDSESAAAGVSTDDESAVQQAREALAARTFAQDCHDLADRAQLILRNSDFVQFHPAERYLLRSLIVTSHAVGDNAECAPHLYTEAK